MSKGQRLLFCKECNKKRFCSRISIPNYNFRWTCSKGHSWVEVGITIGRIEAALKDAFSSDKFKNLFERDNAFYRTLEKRR